MKVYSVISAGFRGYAGLVVLGGLVWWPSWPGSGGGVARARSGKRPLARPLATPKRPSLPFHKDRVCRKDKDCVFRPSVCPLCDPCKPAWRPVCNRKKARQIRSMRARVRCKLRYCRPCARHKNWLGHKAVCFRRQCAVAPLRTRAAHGDLECKRNSDCGFMPGTYCLCRPCGLYWLQVANRRAIRREKLARAVRGDCLRPRCKPCARRALGKKVLCISGRCAIR